MDTSLFTKDDKYLMLAFDHRGSYKKMITPYSKELAIKTKKDIISGVFDQISGILIDLDYGFPAYTQFPNPKPFLLPLEKSGYTDEMGERVTEIGYTSSELKDMGAAGVKLLIYFNKDLKTSTKQLETTKKALQDARENNMPFFLEIVNYGNEDDENRIVNSLKVFLENEIYPDIYKLEYPGNRENAEKVTKLLKEKNIPWIQLTRGTDFETFKQQLQTSVNAGCIGFLAGRSLWQEYPKLLNESEKENFIKEILPKRFKQISDIVNK
jgi:tagatose-1,6-bisphosphate aldolase